jgi:hypothetical protein
MMLALLMADTFFRLFSRVLERVLRDAPRRTR